MANTPTAEYLTSRLTQIREACQARDGARAVALVQAVRLDGYPECADAIVADLVAEGLRNLLAGAR